VERSDTHQTQHHNTTTPGEHCPTARQPDSCNEVSPVTSSATPKAPAQPAWPRDFDIRARYAEQQELLQPPQPAKHP